MDKRIDSAITQYIALIKSEFSTIESAYLFGSHARGKSTEDSDIDVALIFTELDDAKRFDVQVRLMLLAAGIDSRIEPHHISSADFYSGNPFMVEIKRTGIKLAA